MHLRAIILCAVAATTVIGLLGCGAEPKPNAGIPESYPVRNDWMVSGTLSPPQQPSGYSEAGYPPILQLDGDLSLLTGVDKILASQIPNKVVLNTKKLSDAERRDFADSMSITFGSPENPKVELSGVVAKLQGELTDKEAKVKANPAATVDQLNELATLKDDLVSIQAMSQTFLLDEGTLKQGAKLYRDNCQQCHGLTGNGNGPAGRYLIPIPRDYRQGLFKFISSDPQKVAARKPRRDDLYRTITHGLDGSPMPSFAGFTAAQTQSVISYVTHLSMRGEAEYRTMRMVLNDNGDFNNTIAEQMVIELSSIARNWIKSENNPIVPDPDPYTTDEKRLEAAANGHKLFVADDKTGGGAGCATCHVQYGRQDYFKFDDWGSVVRPRNLTQAPRRGGREPYQIYSRIYGGILGSNMPEHSRLRPTVEERTAGKNKIWDLVHFVEIISQSEGRQKLKEKYQIEIDQ